MKKSDPGPFTVPCYIEAFHVERCLVDLGASVNIMPLSICKVLGHEMELKLIADQTQRRPIGIWEDAIIKVRPFTIPIDFLILDIEVNVQTLIIFRRPFLATAGTFIDCGQD